MPFHRVIIAIFFLHAFCARAQVVPFISEKSLSPTKKYSVQYWTTENGLPQNSVNAIAQTRDGYLWLATYDGLVQFDGVKFRTYNSSNTPQLKTSGIRRLYVDPEDRLWLITSEGTLLSYANRHFTNYALPQKVDYIKNTLVYFNGNLVAGCGDYKLYQLKGKRFERLSAPAFHIIYCLQTIGNFLFVGTDKGLWRYDGKTWLNMPGFEEMGMSQLYVSPRQELLVDAEYNLYWVRGTTKISIPLPFSLKPLNEYKLSFDQHGRMVILTDQGLFTMTDKGFSSLTTEDGLSTNVLNSYFIDREKNIWVGTNNGGLNRLKVKLFKAYSKEDGMFEDGATAIAESKNGSIYIGNNCRGTSEFFKNHFVYGLPQLKNDVCTWSLMEDLDGQLWVGTYGGGVSIYRKNGKVDNYRIPSGLPDNVIFSMFTDSKNMVWIGTSTGLAYYSNGIFSIPDTSFHHKVTYITETSTAQIWLCTDAGLAFLLNNKVVYPGKKIGLKEGAARYLYEDSDHTLWAGTSGNGLVRIKGNKAFHYTSFTNQLDKNVWSIVEDGAGNFWMPSNSGMYVVNKKDLNDFAENRTRSMNVTYLGKEDGLKSIEFNGGFQPSALKAQDRTFWFPTVKGAVQADPSALVKPGHNWQVVIERIAIDDSLIDPVDTLAVSKEAQNITLYFTAPCFVNATRLSFQFMIEGVDKDWNNLGTTRELKLNAIPDGLHRLRIRVAGRDQDREASLVIFKPIPWWKQTTFVLTAVISFLILLMTITVTSINVIHKREKRKTQLHKQYANIELKALQSQLNPHFIFNCLNSIQHFILAGDEKSANHYLTQFSSLMRMFLEHSKSNIVTLQQECDLLKLYVEIESLRFKNGFDFKLEVEKGIDTYNIQIPSMLFQPFVENAIKHGLLNLDRKGSLHISFSIKEGELVGMVDDDGIGRAQARALQRSGHSERQSRGMEITTDRIATINYIENTNISVEVVDKIDGASATGTRVIIKIPI